MSQLIATQPESYELSSHQKRIWAINPTSQQQISYSLTRLKGDVDVNRLQQSLDTLIQVYEVSRIWFNRPAGVKYPLQRVAESCSVPVIVTPLPLTDSFDYSAFEHQLSQKLAVTEVNCFNQPYCHCELLQSQSDTHYLVLALPALCVDKSGIKLLTDELLGWYDGQKRDFEDRIQFLDVIDELNEQLIQPVAQQVVDNCKNTLGEVNRHINQLNLSNHHVRPAEESNQRVNMASYSQVIDVEGKLAEFSKIHGWHMRSVLLSVWQIFLNRMSHQQVAIGVVYDGRQDSELAQLVGSLSRVIPGYLPIDKDQTLLSLFGLAEQQLNYNERHQEYFDWQALISETQPYLTRYGFSFYDHSKLEVPCYGAQNIISAGVSDQFDLHLSCDHTSAGLSLSFHFDTLAFCLDTIKLMAARLEKKLKCLLAMLASTPQSLVSTLHSVSDCEKLLFAEGVTPLIHDIVVPVHDKFSRFAVQIPNKVALETENGRFNFAYINRKAEQLAGYLQSKGIGQETLVALSTGRDENFIISLLAILKVGAVYIPLDPKLQAQRIAYIIEDTGCRWVLTVAEQKEEIKGLVTAIVVDQLETEGYSFVPVIVESEQLAYLIYTSGSTGKPKGVGVSHGALFHYITANYERLALSDDASLMSLACIATDLGHTTLFGALMTGRTLQLFSSDKAMDADALAQQMSTNPVGCLKIVPSHLQALLSVDNPARVLPTECLVLGGEALSAQLIETVRSLKPGLRIVNHYGPTETTVGILTHEVSQTHLGNCPIGSPLNGAQRFVVNAKGDLVGIGVIGELYLGGVALAQGYWCRADLTADKFVPDVFSGLSGQRLYRTGDLAYYRADGELVYVGRSDHQVKVRGFRVELGEVETALCSHSHVQTAVVLLQTLSSSEKSELVAHVLLSKGQQLDVEEIQTFLRQKLPGYMVPVALQSIKEMPLTRGGKIDRATLGRVERHGKISADYQAPKTDVEKALTQSWQSLLGVEKIGMNDSFFALGGHSLLVTQQLSWVRKTYNANTSIKAFFDAPTIAAQAEFIKVFLTEKIELTNTPFIVANQQETDGMLLSFGQERLWLTQHLNQKEGLYNTPHTWCLEGKLDVHALKAAFSELVSRHQVLRTRFVMLDGKLLKQIDPAASLELTVTDVSDQWGTLDQAMASDSTLINQVNEIIGRDFDLEQGPLYSIHLFCVAKDKHVLLFNLHHIISDGWSLGVIQREISILYGAFAKGTASPLTMLEYQYTDYAAWQRIMQSEGKWDSQMQYWRSNLSALPELKFPPLSGKVQSSSGTHKFYFDDKITKTIKNAASDTGLTPFMYNMALLKLVIGHHCKQHDFAIGTSIAGRNQQETNPMIGFFVNQLVLRMESNPTMKFSELLEHVKTTTLAAYDNQDLPFSLIASTLDNKTEPGKTPFFNVLYVFQDFPDQSLEIDDVKVSGWASGSYDAKFGLTLYMGYENNLLSGTWVYDKSVIDEQSVKNLTTYYKRVVKQVINDNALSLDQITYASEAELVEQAVQRRKSKMDKFNKVKRR